MSVDFAPATTMDELTPSLLPPALAGARIRQVRQPAADRIALVTHRAGAGSAHWVFSLHPEAARFGRVFGPPAGGGRPPLFCQWLRTRLVGGRVAEMRRPHPQILELLVTQKEATFHLVLELNRRDSNLLLLDGERRLLIALRHPALPGRKLGAGQPYRPPARMHSFPGRIPLEERLPAPDDDGARARAETWREREARFACEAEKRPLLRQAGRLLKKCRRRLEKLEAERVEVERAESWRRRGELLQIHHARLSAGMEAITVQDVFQPGHPAVTIPLDPQTGAAENIQRCFKRYRKLRDAADHVQRRLARTERELEQWNALATRLREVGDSAALTALLHALSPALGRELGLPVGGKHRAAGAPRAGGDVLRRYSAEGYPILVGRSGEENDRVTFSLGRGRDWWFHAQGLTGSHVIVVNPGGASLPGRTLREAAWLAGYFSRGRQSGTVEVDYTQRKYVRKIKGGAPGQVTYAQNRSLAIRLDDGDSRQVLDRTDPPPESGT